MSITLKEDQFCNAEHFKAFNVCLWGHPKASIICGNCKRPFKTRDYVPYNRGHATEAITANCPHCGKWNIIRGITLA